VDPSPSDSSVSNENDKGMKASSKVGCSQLIGREGEGGVLMLDGERRLIGVYGDRGEKISIGSVSSTDGPNAGLVGRVGSTELLRLEVGVSLRTEMIDCLLRVWARAYRWIHPLKESGGGRPA